MTLDELCIFYGADKSPKLAHSYAPKYDELFTPVRESTKTLLEIGVGYSELMEKYANWNKPEPLVIYTVGASIHAWRDWFPNANIYGLDIDPRAQVVGQERIKTFLGNACQPGIIQSVIKETGPLDIVIDDGSHFPFDQIQTARLLLPHMKKGGLYCIEDIEDPKPLLEEFKDLNIELFDWCRPGYDNDRILLIKC